jgi:hypothetical protein
MINTPHTHTQAFMPSCGNSSVGRAQPFQGWGREFEPRFPLDEADVAQLVERVLGKDEVMGSNPIIGS